MEEMDPLLAGDTRSDLSVPRPPPAHPEGVDGEAKNLDSGESGPADADQVAGDEDAKSKEPGILVPSAGKKEEERKSSFLGRIFRGRGATGSGDASTSGPRVDEHVVDVTPPTPTAPTVAPGDLGRDGQPKDHASGQKHDLNEASSQVTKNRRFFPSAAFPFSLVKAPTEAAAANTAGGEERPLESDCADLVGKLEGLKQCCRGPSATIADPTARLIAAIRAIATVDQADSRAKSEAKFEVILAAASLTMVASREEKVPVDVADTARKLASEATALLAKMGTVEPLKIGRDNDFLFCLTITGTLALMPYVSTMITKPFQPFISTGFGVVFAAASVGAVLSFKATRRSDLKVADGLNILSFGLFSWLVLVFVCSALLSGTWNIVLIIICALVLFALHLYAWSRS